MSSPDAATEVFLFGGFLLDKRGGGLFRMGEDGETAPVQVGARALDLLSALVARHGELVTKQEIMNAVWPSSIVEEVNLTVQVSTLRRVLDHDRTVGSCIQTIPGRGYRLIVPVVHREGALWPSLTPMAVNRKVAEPHASASEWFHDRPSIAVLAFQNFSDDPDQEYFSNGIADDIITELSRDRSLIVIARNSSFTYRGRSIDLQQVGRELNVRYVVHGSVRREAGRVRISAQLTDATSGNLVWADRYDRVLEHVFALQDEIAETVAIAVRPAVGTAEQRRVLRKPPENFNAWETYQLGLWHLLKFTRTDNEHARLLFKKAAELDPGFAPAYVGTSIAHLNDALAFGLQPMREAAKLAAADARRAVDLDPNDSEAQSALGAALAVGGDLHAALICADRALAINRNSASGYWVRGASLVYLARWEEGRSVVLTSLRLNPREAGSPQAASALIASYYFERDYAAAIEMAERYLADYPDYAAPRRLIAAALAQLGCREEAAQALEEAIRRSPDVFELFVRKRPPYYRQEDHELVLEGLRLAGWRG